MTNRMMESWGLPPEAAAELVAGMEAVRETYANADDPTQPVLGRDEQPVQWRRETRPPLPATTAHPARVDDAYARAGPARRLMFAEPLSGVRPATARPQRTTVDGALEVAHVRDTRDAACARITLVCDHLNPHPKGACYEAFEPDRARAYRRRIEFCDTPTHGRWLHIAAGELTWMTSQCLRGRRLGEVDQLQAELRLWSETTNATPRGVDWPFQIDAARQKLKRLYPIIKT